MVLAMARWRGADDLSVFAPRRRGLFSVFSLGSASSTMDSSGYGDATWPRVTLS